MPLPLPQDDPVTRYAEMLARDTLLFIFDLDGTLSTPADRGPHRAHPLDYVWIPERRELVQALSRLQRYTAIATNQGGVAFNYLSQPEMIAALERQAKELFVPLDFVQVCFTHPHGTAPGFQMDNDPMRKPNPGMLNRLIEHARRLYGDIPASKIIYVGDRDEDQQAAAAALIPFAWDRDFFWAITP